MTMILYVFHWVLALVFAYAAGKLISRLKLPSILGWLIAGMILGPHAIGLISQDLLDTSGYNILYDWFTCAFGIMLGTELVWSDLKKSGRALIVTTLTQSLGTFAVVSLAFGVIFAISGIPVYLAFVFGGIALATAPAPALSIVNEFKTSGPVTSTLLPMAILDDVVGIVVFFTVNAVLSSVVSGGSVSLGMIPVMIFLPILLGGAIGYLEALVLKKLRGRIPTLISICAGITVTELIGWFFSTSVLPGISLNYTLMGVAYSTVFTNILPRRQLDQIVEWFQPILGLSLLVSIVGLGAPLDYHLILGAGMYTFVYIVSRAFGKYFGARFGATIMKMPQTVRKYLGLTLLPHSGVSLVFTSIACSTLSPMPELVQIVQGTIAAAAVINEIIAVVAAKKGFELAGEIHTTNAHAPQTQM